MPYIFELIDKKLNGDCSRVRELFFDEHTFEDLVKNSEGDQYYNFSPKGYDGVYFFKNGSWYTFYFQDRAQKTDYANFDTLEEGVEYFLKQTKLAEETLSLDKIQSKKWWQFW